MINVFASVEVRVPEGKWSKHVTAVNPRAKTGHDWDGEFLKVDRLVDLLPGELLLRAGWQGSKRSGTKTASLYVVCPEYQENPLVLAAYVISDEWAIDLRELACELLALPVDQRLLRAIELRLAMVEAEKAKALADWENKRTQLQKVIDANGMEGAWPYRSADPVIALRLAHEDLAAAESYSGGQLNELDGRLRWIRKGQARVSAGLAEAAAPPPRLPELLEPEPPVCAPDPRLEAIADADLLAECVRRGLILFPIEELV